MIRFFAILIALTLSTVSTPAFADDAPKEEAKHQCESCAKGKAGESHWCAGCKKGFVDGKEVKCEACFKGKTGETVWCDGCKAGYVGGEKISCQACFDHKSGKGAACAEHGGAED